ncbi:radical SAM family heme chaperone HemW [Schumannella luteola]|uniref:Heme chaperone HemW n=1 Tax=Schumannella luteola TaxID=472059 RepID=A0A852YG95_9MICO|nr:radical SAM family heme chaperone HemW [Schumannella luteola]NYH00325.1 oxygen-independent coproporphyrinogen-3 oxidase [Schumannella luteola]TPX05987.1 coproporphyrinogen III oxidase [Schumannella luteola]
MPSILPEGDPAPADGTLPASAAVGSAERDLGVYVHVPFCTVRCGYCDFNTYTASEIRGVKQSDYAGQALDEIRFAGGVLDRAGVGARPVSTVFFGGGTPTLLPVGDLAAMLHGIRDTWGFAPGAEITTEANPDSVDAADLAALAEAGFTRVSFGMQSAVPEVLATLERTHDPARVPQVVRWAREAGLEVSLDVIYGSPGETADQWTRTLDAVLAEEPGHISAYALIVEQGTKLARQIKRGEVPEPSDDAQADFYDMADAAFTGAGYDWYEVSNFSRGAERRSRHNLAYWTSQDWWGIGPGAHSHVGGVRWWNVKHPAAYAGRIAEGISPAHARETLDDETRRVERVLLETRVVDGLPTGVLDADGRRAVAGLIAEGLVDGRAAVTGRIVLTRPGRLLADAVVRRLLAD